ncbi:MAG: right-handed parallel beta-helix repeat-containing protein [Oscillospiraceae bacterium]|nr:right-handed parallel beta-helix repeat-containing protein [Oscillospiraceae bacterium]
MKILLMMTLSGSALTLFLLFLRYVVLRRMPSTIYYYAWLFVLLRFVLPLPGLIPSFSRPAAPETPVYSETYTREPEEQLPAGLVTQTGVPNTMPAAPSVSQTYVQPEEKTESSAQALRKAVISVDWRSPKLWLSVWAAGVFVYLGMTAYAYISFIKRLRRKMHKPDSFTKELYSAMPGRKPALFRSGMLRTSLMFGVFSPRIVLPEHLNDEEDIVNVLHHELMHYRRRDILYKWIAAAVLAVHWFNPIIWLVQKELNSACELSCDEMLLRSMTRYEKQSYGNTLLSMAANASLPARVVATTFSTDKKNLKERLEQIMHYKKSKTRVLAAVLALLLLAGCSAVAGPAADKVSGEPKQSDENRPVVKVSSVDEMLKAIAPDTVIELSAGEYDLSTASDYGEDTHSSYYSWNGVWSDDKQISAELVISKVSGLTIRGAGPGETTISAVPRYANVIKFIGCHDLSMSDFTAGHTKEPGLCAGGVLRFESCGDVSVTGCGLFGCGTIGVDAVDTFGIDISGCSIYECSYAAVNLYMCRDAKVENCSIYKHGTREGTGSAMELFSTYYTDGFIICGNSIYENATQSLLKLNYTKNAVFISNEVHDNRFGGAVFSFDQYVPLIDGCSFVNNGQIYQWVLSDGTYPCDITGRSLEAKDFETMKFREIDLETAVKPAPAAAAAEVRPGGSIEVGTMDEFLSAIGPDRTIILNGELFDLSAATNYGSTGGEYYTWQPGFDGPQLVIWDVDGLSIQASAKDSKATTLSAIPRYANVLSFQNCNDLQLIGFTAGHTKEPGSCAGGVLEFQSCNNVKVDNMRLFGCGILGIQASNCATVGVLRTEIYECSQGAARFYRTDGIVFDSCDIHNVQSPALVFNECGDKVWNGEPISGLNGEYDVDKNGSLTQPARGNMMPESAAQPDEELIYDEKGQLSIVRETIPGEGIRETRYFYSEDGCYRWEIWLNDELRSINIYEEFELDPTGENSFPLRRSTYNGESVLQGYQLYKYDYDKQTKRIETYSADGTLVSYRIQESSNNWSYLLSDILYSPDGTVLEALTYPKPGINVFFYTKDITGSGITTKLSSNETITLRAEAPVGSGVFTWTVDREGIYELSPNKDGSECVLRQIGIYQGFVYITVERDGIQGSFYCVAMP